MRMLDLAPWPGLTAVRRLDGGHRNEVWEVHGADRRYVARRSRREPPSLDWELDLLQALGAEGTWVPRTVRTAHDERHAHGVVVQTWLDGHQPSTHHEWALVSTALQRVHAFTRGWPQRPGFRSTQELLRTPRGGDVDLDAMPGSAVADCRAAWRTLTGRRAAKYRPAVVHGDPGSSNIRIDGDRVGLLDWDEARVDHPDLDLASIPGGPLRSERLRRACDAVDAWEAANGWTVELEYARRRLADLRARR